MFQLLLIFFGILVFIRILYIVINAMDEGADFSSAISLGIGSLGCFGVIGMVFWLVFSGFFGPPIFDGDSDNDSVIYDNTPDEWGPGSESNNNPGYHNVRGYYRSDGTYVEPYIRSNPDGNLSNNLNP